LDGLGRLTQVFEDPVSSTHLNYETDYKYDALDNLTRVDQWGGPQGNSGDRLRTFTYDSLSHMLCSSNPENSSAPCPTTATASYTTGTTGYSYDANGNVVTKIALAPNQIQTGTATVTTTYSYDALNRLTQKSYSDGTTPTATYTYDLSSVDIFTISNPVGHLVKTATAGNFPTKTYYTYDSMGRTQVRGECVYINNCGTSSPSLWEAVNGYDLAGNLISYSTYTNSSSPIMFGYSVDAASRLSQLTSSWADSSHEANLFTVDSSIGYFPNGALRKVTFGNGLIETDVLNVRLQPCRIATNSTGTPPTSCTDTTNTGNILDFTYGFNAGTSNNGNLMSWSATGNQTFSRSFTYDPLNRIFKMTETNGIAESCKPASPPNYTLTWTIDAWGNRTAQTPGTNQGTCLFNQAVNSKNQFVSNSYAYDAAGNITNDGIHNYSYDAENRILYVDYDNTAIYVYDAEGRRVAKAAGSTTTYYVYNPDGQVDSERDGNNNWVQTYIHFGNKLVALYRGSNTGFFHQDHLGSTRLVTLSDKSIYENMDFLPFGEQIAGGSGVTHKFTEKEHDGESNLDNFGARYYSSALGRFMTPDWAAKPITVPYADFGDPQSLNLYSYVKNNTLSTTDPDGHCCWDYVKSHSKDWAIGAAKGVINSFIPGSVPLFDIWQAGVGPLRVEVPPLQPSNAAQADAMVVAMTTTIVVTAVAAPELETTSAPVTETFRGFSSMSEAGGIMSSETNAAGGTVYTSTGKITGDVVRGAVSHALYEGATEINVLSGVDGAPNGTTEPNARFLRDDNQAFADVPQVNVYDFSQMTESQVKDLVNSTATTIGGFCDSGACLRTLIVLPVLPIVP
jgi:RHS repeat-associated protein